MCSTTGVLTVYTFHVLCCFMCTLVDEEEDQRQAAAPAAAAAANQSAEVAVYEQQGLRTVVTTAPLSLYPDSDQEEEQDKGEEADEGEGNQGQDR